MLCGPRTSQVGRAGLHTGCGWLAWTVDHRSQALEPLRGPSDKAIAGKGEEPCVRVREGAARLELGHKGPWQFCSWQAEGLAPHPTTPCPNLAAMTSVTERCCLSTGLPIGQWQLKLPTSRYRSPGTPWQVAAKTTVKWGLGFDPA